MSFDEAKDAQNPDSIQDLTDASVPETDAAKVKGGFNPQPDPPGKIRGFDPQPDPPVFNKIKPVQGY